MKYLALPLVVAFGVSVAAASSAGSKDKRPSLAVKASPAIAFSPARIIVTADLKGGDNEQELYCPTVEWEWGDGTRSDASADCDPYVEGKSEIKRHFSADRIFRSAGEYRVSITLKQKDKVVAAGTTYVKIRPGIADGGGIGR